MGPTEDEAYNIAETTIGLVERSVTKDWVFEYWLCLECAVLIGLKSEVAFPTKKTVK